MPRAPTRKPTDQKQAAVNMDLRGPTRSTQVPATAADNPSITIAIENTMPIWVFPVSKFLTRPFLDAGRVSLADTQVDRQGGWRNEPAVEAGTRDAAFPVEEGGHTRAPQQRRNRL